MVARVGTVAFQGIEAVPVDVQVMVAPGKVGMQIVGLPDKAVVRGRRDVVLHERPSVRWVVRQRIVQPPFALVARILRRHNASARAGQSVGTAARKHAHHRSLLCPHDKVRRHGAVLLVADLSRDALPAVLQPHRSGRTARGPV